MTILAMQMMHSKNSSFFLPGLWLSYFPKNRIPLTHYYVNEKYDLLKTLDPTLERTLQLQDTDIIFKVTLDGYKKYTSQNIQKCIEISDIHINNPKSDEYGHSELRSQLAWYVSLMMHPGLVMPTSMESCMQLAYE